MSESIFHHGHVGNRRFDQVPLPMWEVLGLQVQRVVEWLRVYGFRV